MKYHIAVVIVGTRLIFINLGRYYNIHITIKIYLFHCVKKKVVHVRLPRP